MPQGIVKWFSATKGYGFIEPEDGGRDIFVHVTAINEAGIQGLSEGQKLVYALKEREDGRVVAVDLVVTADEPSDA